MLNQFVRGFAPLAAMAFAAAASGCKVDSVSINGEEGKPLSDLDLSGDAPRKLIFLGPDSVEIQHGKKLAITVEGDDAVASRLRFMLKDGALGILRAPREEGDDSSGKVLIKVTMPAPEDVLIAGSGSVTAQSLAKDAQVKIAGSGAFSCDSVDCDELEVDIAGSGTVRLAGSARELLVVIAGSGDAELGALKADEAKVKIMGSGNCHFASDGTVRAKIMGSGEVRITGRATCKVSTMGAGKLICEPAPSSKADSGEKPGKSDRKHKKD